MIVGLDPHTGLDRSWFYDYFRSTLETDRSRFPSTGTIREWLAGAGLGRIDTFEAKHFDRLYSAKEALEQDRLDKTQSSQFALLGDEEYRLGITRLRRDIETAASGGEDLVIVSDLRVYATVGWTGRYDHRTT